MAKMTPKEELFCREYIIDFNATRAAKKAGYSEKTAFSTGSENLRKPKIQKRIAQLRKGDIEKLDLTRERILQEYARIAFFDIRKVYDEAGNLLPIAKLDYDQAAAISGIEVDEIKLDQMVIGHTKKIKISDKRGALDSLCKVLGHNSPEKVMPVDGDGNYTPPMINIYTMPPPSEED